MKRLFEDNNTFTQNKYNKVVPCWFLINDYPCIFIDNYCKCSHDINIINYYKKNRIQEYCKFGLNCKKRCNKYHKYNF